MKNKLKNIKYITLVLLLIIVSASVALLIISNTLFSSLNKATYKEEIQNYSFVEFDNKLYAIEEISCSSFDTFVLGADTKYKLKEVLEDGSIKSLDTFEYKYIINETPIFEGFINKDTYAISKNDTLYLKKIGKWKSKKLTPITPNELNKNYKQNRLVSTVKNDNNLYIFSVLYPKNDEINMDQLTISKYDFEGNLNKSLLLGDISLRYSSEYISNKYILFKNEIDSNTISLTLLDTELNVLWNKEFNTNSSVITYMTEDNIFLIEDTEIIKIDITTGDVINKYSFDMPKNVKSSDIKIDTVSGMTLLTYPCTIDDKAYTKIFDISGSEITEVSQVVGYVKTFYNYKDRLYISKSHSYKDDVKVFSFNNFDEFLQSDR